MRFLVVGSGAREHALCWRLAADGAERVIAVPGNGLMTDVAELHTGVSASDHESIIALARSAGIDLVVVGPEAPLVDGLSDRLSAAGVACFGPTAAAARIEGSKSFARAVCQAAGVPVAMGASFQDSSAAIGYVESIGAPVVVKADGLAGGKGVAVCATLAEAELNVRAALEGNRFGPAGRMVVIEEYLSGVEASVISICDGEDAVVLPAARDHKRLLDGDLGPNTGGMGAFSPVDELGDAALEALVASVFRPVLRELAHRGSPFRGALFAGLMLTSDGPRVLEFNARFGDPETQAILPRLAGRLVPLLMHSALGHIRAAADLLRVPEGTGAAVAITLATHGYPELPRFGDRVTGIEDARRTGALVFGAGARRDEAGVVVTAGGRVLTVVGQSHDIGSAADAAYAAAERISFAGQQMRRDVGRSMAGAAA